MLNKVLKTFLNTRILVKNNKMVKKKRKKKKAKKKARKVRRVKAKAKVRRARPKLAMKRAKPSRPTSLQAAYTLTMAGGIIVLIAGILALFFSSVFALTSIAGSLIDHLVSLICGVILLITASTIKKNPRNAAIIILLFSIIALVFPPHGFIVGPILSLIASIVLLVRRSFK